ncbi:MULTISPECIES: DUF721 domain-containing protein [Bacteroidales]|jgi:hypothetical protein|uniref:DUF721 domain-containing protein n=1 Tax=Bacteroidales TaxID=171549 RepID=UPI00241D78CE|nr:MULTISPECIES: DUF721 domain-containing protein [Bacteroidales]
MKRKKAEPIDNILARYLRHIGLETPLNQYRLINAWALVVGENVAKKTKDIYIKNQTLCVSLQSPVLRSDLQMKRQTLIARLNATVGTQVIVDIHFT